MTYIIAEPCIDVKDVSCVDACPVDCTIERKFSAKSITSSGFKPLICWVIIDIEA